MNIGNILIRDFERKTKILIDDEKQIKTGR